MDAIHTACFGFEYLSICRNSRIDLSKTQTTTRCETDELRLLSDNALSNVMISAANRDASFVWVVKLFDFAMIAVVDGGQYSYCAAKRACTVYIVA